RKTGSRETIDIANRAPQEEPLPVELESTKLRSASCTVCALESVRKMSGPRKSSQVQMKVKIAVVASAGTISGRMTRQKIRRGPPRGAAGGCCVGAAPVGR